MIDATVISSLVDLASDLLLVVAEGVEVTDEVSVGAQAGHVFEVVGAEETAV